ncbi:HAD family hydrolase [candidate division KSB1 bacterium]|nr:HAD family hydrolase [candidate division KSB1 bacterium]
MTNAVFFDRDDTIIKNIPYLGDPSKVVLMPGAKKSLQKLKDAGFLLFIISNQSGVGRGYITRDQVSAVNSEMDRQLGNSYFTAKYCCYESPENSQLYCRKPLPKMINKAAKDFSISLPTSYCVGDKLSDILAGRRAGCKSILLKTGHEKQDFIKAQTVADYMAEDLLQATAWILKQRT